MDDETYTGKSAAGPLRALLEPSPEIRLRALTGAVLWGMGAVAVIANQVVPGVARFESGTFLILLLLTVGCGLLITAIHHRLTARQFQYFEQAMMLAGSLAVAAVVIASGGVESPAHTLYLFPMIYAAYFLRRPTVIPQILFGSALMVSPLVYDAQASGALSLKLSALVSLIVFWIVALVIAAKKSVMTAAQREALALSLTDPLTGLANLRAFRTVAQETFGSGRPGGALALIDLNGLKAANSIYGHGGGDRLLSGIARALVQAAGRHCLVARIGGDEFAVIMPGATGSDAQQFSQRLLSVLADENSSGEYYMPLSFASGIAVSGVDAEAFDDLSQIADSRMFADKPPAPVGFAQQTNPGLAAPLARLRQVEPEQTAGILADSLNAAALAWGVAALVTLSAAAFLPAMRFQLTVLAALGIALAGLLVFVPARLKPAAKVIGDVMAVALFAPALLATGGTSSLLLPLIFLVVAHACYFYGTREALLKSSAMVLVAYLPLLIDGGGLTEISRLFFVQFACVVVGVVLQWNRRTLQAAEAQAAGLSLTDSLTQLANRRAFIEQLRRRTGQAFAIALFDIDDFKLINTAYGHAGGDRALIAVADLLREAVQDRASAYRIGGDEFAVVCARTGYEAYESAQCVVRDVEALGEKIGWGAGSLTVSAGVASSKGSLRSWNDVLIAADTALARSKDAGKNVSTSETSVLQLRAL